MSDNFFKIKNGLNLPTLANDPTVTPPAGTPSVGDMAMWNGEVYVKTASNWEKMPAGPITASEIAALTITDNEVSNTAAIAGTKISPNFGSQNVQTTGSVSAASATLTGLNVAGVVHNNSSGNLSTSKVVNVDVDAAAAIDGTKISPNFGSQNVTTSGTISTTGTSGITSAGLLRTNSQLQVFASGASEAVYIEQQGSGKAIIVADQSSDTSVTLIDSEGKVGIGVDPSVALGVSDKLTVTGDVKVSTGDIKFDTAKGIESYSPSSSLNIGTTTNTSTINIGTGTGVQSLNIGTGSNTQTVNIGTGAGVTTINIGGAGDTVNISGTLTWVNTTNLEVTDKLIAVNKGGTTVGGNGAGVQVLGDADAVIAQALYDSSLTSKWKVGASGTEKEVVTVNDSQTLSNKTIGTIIAQSGTLSLTGTGALKIPVGTSAEQPAGVQGMIRYDTTASAFQGYDGTAWSSIGGATTIKRITQATSFAVGDVLYLNGTTYTKALATTAAAAEVCAVVSRVITAGSVYEITLAGEVSGLLAANFDENALPVVGENVFLSPTNAGKMTITEPSVVGQVSKPVGIVSEVSGGSGKLFVDIKRGAVVGGANVRTQIGLANNATTTVQNASAYDAGELAGWVYIDATTDSRFYVQAQFAKAGLASPVDYNLSYQTTGDTPPAGFSMSITSAGLIQVTLPTIAGFVAGGSYINFALNAPAVGTSLPLQISSANVSFTDIQAASSAGITFKEDGGTAVGSVSDAGAWSLGPSGYAGSHIINGATKVNNIVSTSNSSSTFVNLIPVSTQGFALICVIQYGTIGWGNRFLAVTWTGTTVTSTNLHSQISAGFAMNTEFQISSGYLQVRNNLGYSGSTLWHITGGYNTVT